LIFGLDVTCASTAMLKNKIKKVIICFILV
jgi:hypothetical protein